MAIVLGVDIGTTSAKCLAVEDSGRILAFAQQAYPMSHPYEDWAEQDPEDYLRALAVIVRQCVGECQRLGRALDDVRTMALSAQADTLIVADANGRALRPAISWMGRATEEWRALVEEHGEAFWREHAGQRLTPYSSACKIRRLQRTEPALMASRPHIAYVPDFLARRLTGRWINDVPSASWSPFVLPTTRALARPVMDVLGVSEEQLSPTLDSGQPIGELLPDVWRDLGLAEGVLLVAGAFDQTAAAHGAGATACGTSVLSCGTAWVLYAVTDSPPSAHGPVPSVKRPDPPRFDLCVCCHVSPNEWGLVLPYTGGSAYDWVTRTTAPASAPSDASPLVFVPHLYGGLSPDWQEQSKGSLLGLTLSHTAEDIRLALMRGMAFETRRNIEAASAHMSRPSALRMVGGATHSDIWPQMIADAVGLPVEVTALTEAACYGAARIAAGPAADDWQAESHGAIRAFVPSAAGMETMDRLYRDYLAAYAWLTRYYRGEHAPPTED